MAQRCDGLASDSFGCLILEYSLIRQKEIPVTGAAVHAAAETALFGLHPITPPMIAEGFAIRATFVRLASGSLAHVGRTCLPLAPQATLRA